MENGQFENLNAIMVSDCIYKIDNSPFYVYGVSCGDEVHVKKIGDRMLFDFVEKRGGHSTYRIKIAPGLTHDYFTKIFSPLSEMGCTFEGTYANGYGLYSIDIPRECDVDKAYGILQQMEDAGKWIFEEVYFFNGD